MEIKRYHLVVAVLMSLVMLAGCGGGGDEAVSPPATDATLRIVATNTQDAPSRQPVDRSLQVVAINVTISALRAFPADGGPVVIPTDDIELDLIQLVGQQQSLAVIDQLPAGDYVFIGMIVKRAEVVVEDQGEQRTEEVVVPSGAQTGLKIPAEFTIGQGVDTTVVVDWRTDHSFHRTGSGKWMLQPTALVATVSQNYIPSITCTADPTEGVAPLEVQFAAEGNDSDGEIVSYAWDFGDGGMSDQQNPMHTYEDVGTYTATVTVTDNGGATATASLEITVTGSAQALMFYDNFDDEPTGGYPSQWNIHEQSPSSTRITVDETVYHGSSGKSLKFVDTNYGLGCWIEKQCVEPYEKVAFEWYQMQGGPGHLHLVTYDSQGARNVYFLAREQESAFWYDDATGTHKIQEYEVGRWYKIREEVNVLAGTYDIYIDDQPKVVGASFRRAQTQLTGFAFETGGNGRAPDGVWIDDFKEYKLP